MGYGQGGLGLAGRGPCKLALLARTPPAATPLDEEAARKQIRAELVRMDNESAGSNQTTFGETTSADEARQNVKPCVPWCRGQLLQVDTSDADDVMSAMILIEQDEAINGVIHGAGIEEID